MRRQKKYVVVISANAEWRVVRNRFKNCRLNSSPYGDWFSCVYDDSLKYFRQIVFFHGGWGKVAAAASTQYVIDQWHPRMVINLGTCGGFEGKISKGEIILADKTVIYDLFEQMGDPDEHILHYTTQIDTSWISKPYPIPVRQALLVSGDRDLFGSEIPKLIEKYGAIAGDWESGAIAWVSNKNHTRCLILRGVTDIVGEGGGEAYNGNIAVFYKNTEEIMEKLINSLPHWLLKQMSTSEVERLKYYESNNNS